MLADGEHVDPQEQLTLINRWSILVIHCRKEGCDTYPYVTYEEGESTGAIHAKRVGARVQHKVQGRGQGVEEGWEVGRCGFLNRRKPRLSQSSSYDLSTGGYL